MPNLDWPTAEQVDAVAAELGATEYFQRHGKYMHQFAAVIRDFEKLLGVAQADMLERCKQVAYDATSDDPQPGTWNDACEHIQAAIRSLPTGGAK